MRNGLSAKLIERILGIPMYTLDELDSKFPPRDLADGAVVTRFAPSPTGFMHIGNLYGMLIDKKLATQSGGVFFLRIEDTDTKREVDGAIDVILNVGNDFGLMPDEHPAIGGGDVGAYGPYRQSDRRDIYRSVAADLLLRGLAYPCFLTSDEMNDIRAQQKEAGYPTGIYGEWARDRDLGEAEIIKYLDAGSVPSIRLYSFGDVSQKTYVRDAVRGSIEFPQNNSDEVIIKSNDGLPTYHFAHLVDDHFMRVTHVVRGEEWLPSAPLHVQMFQMMGWEIPKYIHTSTLDTIDAESGKQRKLSKRKDRAALVSNFMEEGWPTDAVLEYLFNIMASGYEEAKVKGAVKSIWEWDLKLKKIPTSGALFDWKKLEWWGKEFIATLPVPELVERIVTWAKEYDPEWMVRINASHDGNDYLTRMLAIERDNPTRIRKDFVTWKQTLDEVAYFWDDIFQSSNDFEFDKNVLSAFMRGFGINDDKGTWWNKIRELADENGLKPGDIAMQLRVALTGRPNTPDLFAIMQVMGDKRVRERIERAIK